MNRILFFYVIIVLLFTFFCAEFIYSQEAAKDDFLVFNTESEKTTVFLVEKWSDLSFGYVYGGTKTDISVTNSNAAMFHVFSDKKGWFQLTFNLPSALSLGGASIPVTFDQNHAVYNINKNTSATGTNFNPSGPLTIYLDKNWDAYIWLGGVLQTPGGAVPGYYTATITFNVEK